MQVIVPYIEECEMDTGELEEAFELFKETLNKYGCHSVAMAYVLPGGGMKLEFRGKQTNTEGTFIIEQYEDTTSFLIIFNGHPLVDKMTVPHSLTIQQINERLETNLNSIHTLLL